jgi:hypothetical protein
MRHMEKQHTYSNTAGTINETLTAKQKMNEIFERLENFDWCTCQNCLMHCQLFFDHIVNNHSAEAVVNQDHAYNESPPFKKQKMDDLPSSIELVHDDDNDYFESTDINLPLKNEVILEPVSESANMIMDKNSKKMYVKVKKSTYPEVLEHIEVHGLQMETVFDPVGDSEKEEEDEKPDVDLDDFLADKVLAPKFPLEYQCALCGNIYKSCTTVKRCLEKHVDNGWKEGEPVQIESNDINMVSDFINLLGLLSFLVISLCVLYRL